MVAYRLHFTDSQVRAIELARSGKLKPFRKTKRPGPRQEIKRPR